MALTVRRGVGESILVGDDVVVTIAKVEGGRVDVSITAPREVPILRAELAHKPAPPRPDPERGGAC